MDYNDDIEQADIQCPKCGNELVQRRCHDCEDGFSHHDCGEDTCCCLDPEDNVKCDECSGHGRSIWCQKCGWDYLENR